MHGQWTVIAPLHALISLDSHLDPSQHDLWFGAAHSEHCPGLGQSELSDLPNTFLCGMFPPYLPCLSMVLLRLQSAQTANSCCPIAKNKLAVPAPSGPSLLQEL